MDKGSCQNREDSDSAPTSSLMKVLGEETIGRLIKTSGAVEGDAVLIVAGRKSVVAASLGALRQEVARRENLIDRTKYECLIVTEFPMFEHDEETDEYPAHHPFTSPMEKIWRCSKRQSTTRPKASFGKSAS